MLGFLGRSGALELPPGLQPLTRTWVIAVAAGLYVVEFFADKIPLVDTVWDAVHTFIRVPAAVVLGFAALNGASEPLRVIAALLSGAVALSAHGLKAGARAVINTSPEPVTNWTASLTEDGLAAVLLYLVVRHPLAAFLAAAGVVVAALFALRFIRRVLRKKFPGAPRGAAA